MYVFIHTVVVDGTHHAADDNKSHECKVNKIILNRQHFENKL